MSAKEFSKFLLPYSLKGYSSNSPYSIKSLKLLSHPNFAFFPFLKKFGFPLPMNKNLEEMGRNFNFIYKEICSAIVDHDLDYLSQIMEPRLFKSFNNALDNLHQKNYKLKFIDSEDDAREEESNERILIINNLNAAQRMIEIITKKNNKIKDNYIDPVDIFSEIDSIYRNDSSMVFVEAKGVFGMKINRNENPDENYWRIRSRNNTYYLNKKDLLSLYKNQILVFNVFLYTKAKIVLYNDHNELVLGKENPSSWVLHKFKFESYIPNLDWVLTDIDEFLVGNQYLKRKHIIPKEEEEKFLGS